MFFLDRRRFPGSNPALVDNNSTEKLHHLASVNDYRVLFLNPPWLKARSACQRVAWAQGAKRVSACSPGRNARSACQRIAQGGARLCERNPRWRLRKDREPAERATAAESRARLSPISRAETVVVELSWGCARKASLHPRLYASTRFAR